jgi:hypothetical protein
MIFEALPEEWPHNGEGGAYYDLRNQIQKGLTYTVSCLVMSTEGTDMQFRLWVHDVIGNNSVATNSHNYR